NTFIGTWLAVSKWGATPVPVEAAMAYSKDLRAGLCENVLEGQPKRLCQWAGSSWVTYTPANIYREGRPKERVMTLSWFSFPAISSNLWYASVPRLIVPKRLPDQRGWFSETDNERSLH